MLEASTNTLWILTGYIFGAIPFGLVLCFISGYGDIRKMGSGNIGATNVLRNTTKTLAFFTLILDAGKGAIATIICFYFTESISLSAWVGLSSVLGHNFPIWLGFKGGKGIATTFGTLLAISPAIGALTISTWLVASKITRTSSASALIAITLSPVYTYYIGIFSTITPICIMTIIGVIRHKDNIKRILNGTEPKIGQKK